LAPNMCGAAGFREKTGKLVERKMGTVAKGKLFGSGLMTQKRISPPSEKTSYGLRNFVTGGRPCGLGGGEVGKSLKLFRKWTWARG